MAPKETDERDVMKWRDDEMNRRNEEAQEQKRREEVNNERDRGRRKDEDE